jgi:hypothetical protein
MNTGRDQHEEFVSEAIVPVAGTFDAGAMSRGEPGLPARFTWRDKIYTVATSALDVEDQHAGLWGDVSAPALVQHRDRHGRTHDRLLRAAGEEPQEAQGTLVALHDPDMKEAGAAATPGSLITARTIATPIPSNP